MYFDSKFSWEWWISHCTNVRKKAKWTNQLRLITCVVFKPINWPNELSNKKIRTSQRNTNKDIKLELVAVLIKIIWNQKFLRKLKKLQHKAKRKYIEIRQWFWKSRYWKVFWSSWILRVQRNIQEKPNRSFQKLNFGSITKSKCSYYKVIKSRY